jgi:hypothetical protein
MTGMAHGPTTLQAYPVGDAAEAGQSLGSLISSRINLLNLTLDEVLVKKCRV